MNKVQHLAIIMDGNARWAAKNGLSKAEGHKIGADKVKKLLSDFIEFKIPYITLFAFTSENWLRSKKEVSFLLRLFSYYLKYEVEELHKNQVRLKVIGNFDRLNNTLKKQIKNAEELTKHNNKLTLYVAVSYGSRTEIIDACQKIINADLTTIDEQTFRNYLYAPEMPEIDLLIRTSGAVRVSNCFPWQAFYSELYFSPKYWPEFDKHDLEDALNDYAKRQRTFGAR